MASLYIRNLSDALVKAVRIKALEEDTSVDKLLTPFLEMAVNSKPVEYERVELSEGGHEMHVTDTRPAHGVNCRCFQCRKPKT